MKALSFIIKTLRQMLTFFLSTCRKEVKIKAGQHYGLGYILTDGQTDSSNTVQILHVPVLETGKKLTFQLGRICSICLTLDHHFHLS